MQDKQKQEPTWLSPYELYKTFRIAEQTQAQYRVDKKIPYHKKAGKIYYKLSEINAWIESGKVV